MYTRAGSTSDRAFMSVTIESRNATSSVPRIVAGRQQPPAFHEYHSFSGITTIDGNWAGMYPAAPSSNAVVADDPRPGTTITTGSRTPGAIDVGRLISAERSRPPWWIVMR